MEININVTPEIKRQVEGLVRTADWSTILLLYKNASEVEFIEVARDLEEPEPARLVREQTWREKLNERKAVLNQANSEVLYEIHTDEEGPDSTGQLALFEIQDYGFKKRRMWAGTTITLAQRGVYKEDNKIIVPVYPINYTEWVACLNPNYAQAFKEASLSLPYAGIGVSVLMETLDGFIPLTRRGIETPIYPGRLYSPGGGPKPGQTSTESLLEEILEETGLVANKHFQPFNLEMLALVTDSRINGSDHSRPELVAYLPLDATFREVETIQHETSVKKDQRQEDVWGILPYSTFRSNLIRALIYSGFEMCPPTEAGLVHLLFYKAAITEGIEKALEYLTSIMERLKSFERVSAYQPPIKRLAVV